MRVAMGLIHHERRGLERGLGFTMASNVQQAAADIATGDVIGSAVYQENLAAAKQQPDFNQAQFDAWWNCGLTQGFSTGACPEPSFEAYAGTAFSNRPSALPSNVAPSMTSMAPTAPASKPAAKSTGTTTPAITQQQLQAATNAPPVQAGKVPVGGTTVGVAPTGNLLTGSMFGGIPNWLLFGGLAAAGYFAMRATR